MNNIIIDIPKRAFLPCYHHLLESTADIDFLWGGRDSGKSAHIARQLLMDCMRLPYFRCVLARKFFNTIKESQYQMLKDVATEWGVSHLFTFKTNPQEIICNINGNKFICRGMDDPGKLKSISNPSHCWAEEMNQMDLDDFIIIMTSMRYNSGRIKVWCSFNPECDGDYGEYWLYSNFFKDKGKNFISTWDIEVPNPKTGQKTVVKFTYQSTHTTYHDNRYCRAERSAFLEQLAVLDPYYYMVFTLGEWGNRKTDDPFCITFDKDKHVRPTVWVKTLPLYGSFDFNVNPITLGLYQHDGKKIWGVENIKLDSSNIYNLCDYAKIKYPGAVWIFTGDATGKNTSALVQDGINYYTVIKAQFNASSGQIKVPTVNPPIKENRTLVNAVFYQCDVALDPDKCKGLIFDCINVSVTETGDIDKGDRNNPKKRADHLDNFRYYLNTFHKHVLKS